VFLGVRTIDGSSDPWAEQQQRMSIAGMRFDTNLTARKAVCLLCISLSTVAPIGSSSNNIIIIIIIIMLLWIASASLLLCTT
jgi:hypothetical protein